VTPATRCASAVTCLPRASEEQRGLRRQDANAAPTFDIQPSILRLFPHIGLWDFSRCDGIVSVASRLFGNCTPIAGLHAGPA
jgi:hypothetical protein